MGLIVLGFLLVYILISIALMVGADYLGKRKNWKWCRWWTVGLVMLLIPTWDIPIGWGYFKYLCEAEAGISVYERIELPEEYFLKPGERNKVYQSNSKFAYAKGGELDMEMINESYTLDTELYRDFSMWGNMFKRETIVSNRKGDVLGKAISYFYRGGWVAAPFLYDRSGSNVCPENALPGSPGYIHTDIVRKIFDNQ